MAVQQQNPNPIPRDKTLLEKWSCRRNYMSKQMWNWQKAIDRIVHLDDIWMSDKTDANGNVVPSITEGHSVYSKKEKEKLKQAIQLIKEVRANYKVTHFELRPSIK